jgi:Bacterial transcriptional regulator
LILFTDGEIIFETREGRRTSRRAVRPGQGRIIPSGAVEQVRWFSDISRNIRTTHIFLPKELFDSCADEYRSAGSRSREIQHAISWFADPAINAVCRSLVDAAHDGVPGLYAGFELRQLAAIELMPNLTRDSSSLGFGSRSIRSKCGMSTEKRATGLGRLKRDLVKIRERGFALDEGEAVAGIRCLGAAIIGADGKPVAAISVSGPMVRVTKDRVPLFAAEILKAARQISARLGYRLPKSGDIASAGIADRSKRSSGKRLNAR